MEKGRDFAEHLRYRILGLLHAGQIEAGDRLPSIRQVAHQEEVDHRLVARAYRALAEEGLVEIRPGSGIYVAGLAARDGIRTETLSWMTDVLVEGWLRRISRAQVGELVARSVVPLRCACVESNEDHMVALCGEVEEDLSLEMVPVRVGPEPGGAPLDPARLRGVDLVATSVFHADTARAAAAAAGLPVVVLTFDPEFTAAVDRRLNESPLITVVADPLFGARGEAYLAVTRHRGRVRYVLADRLEEEGVDPSDPTVLLTRAARRRLGMEEFHLLPPPLRVVSPHSVRELCRAIVNLTLPRGQANAPAS